MVYEFKIPQSGKDLIKFSGIISIPASGLLSDQIYLKDFGAIILRPILKNYSQHKEGNVDSNLGLEKEDFATYCAKIKEFLDNLKSEYSKVIFIDVRISSSLKDDVSINYKPDGNLSGIDAVLKNLEYSPSIKYVENTVSNFDLIDNVMRDLSDASAVQIILSGELLKSDSEKPLRILEETVIYSHLSLTGKI